MSTGVFLGLSSLRCLVRPQIGLNLWGRYSYQSYATAQRVEKMKNEGRDGLLPFKDFRDRYIESWESFKESPAAKLTYGSDEERIFKAYDRFCLSLYSQYKHQEYGGNPSEMT